MLQTSGALALETLLALVPLVTVVISVASMVPYFDQLILRLDSVIREAFLPVGAAKAIIGNITRFSHQAQQLTLTGIAFLAVTGALLMNTIEGALNRLWRVGPRPWHSRFGLYAFAMMVWPFFLGAVAAGSSFALTTSLGFFDEPRWLQRSLVKGVSIFMLGLFFTFMYYLVPNTRVPVRAALAGGVFSTLAFSGMQKIFEIFLVSSTTLRSIYGAFAAFPVFLLWLQFSWAVILMGGLIAAKLSGRAKR